MKCVQPGTLVEQLCGLDGTDSRFQEPVDLLLRKPLGPKPKNSCCHIVLDTSKMHPISWQFGGWGKEVKPERVSLLAQLPRPALYKCVILLLVGDTTGEAHQ